MIDTSTDRKTFSAILMAPPRFILRAFTMTGGLAIRALMMHDGRWPSIVSGTGLGLLAVGLMSCAAQKYDDTKFGNNAAGWYERCGPSETIRTGWMTEAEYLKLAADQRARGCYPVAIKGDLAAADPSQHLYRATFKPHPDNIVDWRASIGAPAAEDSKFALAMAEEGYIRIWQDDIADNKGLHYVQSVWTKAH